MGARAEIKLKSSRRRFHIVTPEARLADQVVRGAVPGDGVRPIIGVTANGEPVYTTPDDELVARFMNEPYRFPGRRPSGRFGRR